RDGSAVEEIVAVVATHHAEVLGGDALVMEQLDEAPVAVGGHGIVRLPTVRGDENPRGSDGLDAEGNGRGIREGPARCDGAADELHGDVWCERICTSGRLSPGALSYGWVRMSLRNPCESASATRAAISSKETWPVARAAPRSRTSAITSRASGMRRPSARMWS